MSLPRIGAAVIVQNDAETIEKSLASYYPYVERIVVSTDPHRGWTGVPITPDDTLERIRAMDIDQKVTFVEEDFYRFRNPMANDTAQRQHAASVLNSAGRRLHWMAQVDADEVFLDFPAALAFLRHVPWPTQSVFWPWIQIYRLLDDGRFLVVVNEDGSPCLELTTPFLRPSIRLAEARNPYVPHATFGGRVQWRAAGSPDLRSALLHYSWGKSEARIWEKLQTWGHNKDFDIAAIYQQWLNSPNQWPSMKNFHPVRPKDWPALKPFSWEELHALCRAPASY